MKVKQVLVSLVMTAAATATILSTPPNVNAVEKMTAFDKDQTATVQMVKKAPIKLLVDGREINAKKEPVVKDGRTLVPLDSTFAALGWKTDFLEQQQAARMYKDGKTIFAPVDKDVVMVSDKKSNRLSSSLAVPTQFIDNDLFIGMAAIEEADAVATWNGINRSVNVLTAAASSKSANVYAAVPSIVKSKPDYSNGLKAFKKVAYFAEDEWLDISSRAQWAKDGIKNAVEYGIMKGQAEGVFNPGGNMTCAEAITILARIQAIYAYGDKAEAEIAKYADKTAGHWVQQGGYLQFVKGMGILDSTFDKKLDTAITRAEMAYCWAKSIYATDQEGSKATYDLGTTWSGRDASQCYNIVYSLPDVRATDKYATQIFGLYEAGVLIGSDTIGTFRPGTNITREEAAVILYRLIDKSARAGYNPPGTKRSDRAPQKVYANDKDYKIGNVTFNDSEDWTSNPGDGQRVMTLEAQDKFIEEMLKTSAGISVNADGKNFTMSLNLPECPPGYRLQMYLEYYGVITKNGRTYETGGDCNSWSSSKVSKGEWIYSIPQTHGASGLDLTKILIGVGMSKDNGPNGGGSGGTPGGESVLITYDIKNNRAGMAWANTGTIRTDKPDWPTLLFPQAAKVE